MKTFVSGILGLCLFSSVSFAAQRDAQLDLEIEAMALVQMQENRNVFDDIEKFFQQLEEIKEQIVTQFDENGNGRIDPGPELDNFKQTMHDVFMLIADSNQNGRIDLQDIKVLTQFVLDQAKAKALEVACPTIIKKAERAGWWLQFRPVLKHFYEICTFGA